MKILVFEIFEKGRILRPFLGLALSKLKTTKFNGSICAYRVFYLPISGESEGGGWGWISIPPGPCGTEKSVVRRGLIRNCGKKL